MRMLTANLAPPPAASQSGSLGAFIEAQPYETVKDRLMRLGQGRGLKAAWTAACLIKWGRRRSAGAQAASASAKMKPTAQLVRALAHELCVPSRRGPIGSCRLRSLPFQILLPLPARRQAVHH